MKKKLIICMGKSENKKKMSDDELFWSKNNGKNIRYRKRIQNEKEAREAYEDGLKQVEENGSEQHQ